MSDLLVRDMSSSAKEALRRRAAENGRSQQAEAKAILEESLLGSSTSWVARLRAAGQAVGGIDLPEPERHVARMAEVEGWL